MRFHPITESRKLNGIIQRDEHRDGYEVTPTCFMMFPELSYSKVTRSGAIKNNDVTARCVRKERDNTAKETFYRRSLKIAAFFSTK